MSPSPPIRRNWRRRALGAALCSLPLVLAGACAVWPREISEARRMAGMALVGLSLLVALVNARLRWHRPWLYRRRRATMQGYRFVSGLPMVGTLLMMSGCLAGFGSAAVGVMGLLAGALDPDGAPWIIVVTWKDASLWEGRASPRLSDETTPDVQSDSN